MGRGLRNELRGTAAFGDREVKSTNETGKEGMKEGESLRVLFFWKSKEASTLRRKGLDPVLRGQVR